MSFDRQVDALAESAAEYGETDTLPLWAKLLEKVLARSLVHASGLAPERNVRVLARQ